MVITDGGTTTQNFSLADAPSSACLTDTTQADFFTGVTTNVDLNTSPGDVTLLDTPLSDQFNTAGTTTGTGFGTPNFTGQTFIAGLTGSLVQADIQLFCSGCGASPPNLTLSVRATAAGLPTGADLATATVPGSTFASGASTLYTATFGSPATLTSGTQYALILRPVSAPAGSGYFWIRSSPSTYASGSRVLSADSGGTWSTDTTRDYNFRTYMRVGYAASGNLESSTKDGNPAPTFGTSWTTLSWNGATPANTSLQFQVAASNAAGGPFNFVGPDNTAGTFFTTSPASLSQFNGKRYLKYRAYLGTSNSAVTPTLNDATVCFNNLPPPDLSLTKSDGGASVAPGGTVSYTLTYSNAGGVQDATGVVLTETVPANSTFNAGASTAGWSCTPNNNAGSTCTLAIGALAAGSNNSAAFAAAVVNPVAAGVTQISNTASVADDGTHGPDATPANNSASDTTPVTAAPDFSISKSDGGASVAPGGTVAYTLSYANSGSRGATGVVLTEVVPANTAFNAGASTAGWSCTPDNNAGATCTLAIGALVAGGGTQTATYAVNVNTPLLPSITQISNTASIADDASNGVDPTPGNNTGSDTTPITGADLSITKSDGVTSTSAGSTVVYAITASNAGPNAVTGATVTDTFPGSLTCNWTCSGTVGGTCAGSGSGAINDSSVNLAVNASVTYLATCAISPTASVSVTNTATVATPGGVTDPTPANNSATDVDTLSTSADVSVSITDGRAYVRLGESLNYVIVVSNAGPSTAQATVSDNLPALLSGGSWTCTGTAGVTCANGTGNSLSDIATVPPGGKATYVYSATVAAAGGDLLDNSASVSLTTGTDPGPFNNSYLDHDVIVIFKNGFQGATLLVDSIGSGSDYVTGQLRIDADLANGLSVVPLAVARGQSADGKLLFTLELARFGSDLAVRTVTRDAQGMSQRSEWSAVDANARLLSFAWQTASERSSNGYLRVDGGLTPLMISGRGDEGRLADLAVTMEQQVPWLVLITH